MSEHKASDNADTHQHKENEESYQERQDEEFQVLESIYGEAIEDLRKKVAWKVARPLELRLTLKPQQSMGGENKIYTQVDMIVKCSPKYPDVAPVISLTNSKGLSNQLVAELKAELDKKAAEITGEVMIWQLANDVEAFLHKHNKPPPQSFYDQMIINNKQMEEKNKEQERQREEMKRKEMEQEVMRRQEFLKSETRRLKEDQRNSESNLPSGNISKMSTQFNPLVSPITSAQQHTTARSVSPATHNKFGTPSRQVPIPTLPRQRRTSTPKRSDDDDSGTSPSCKEHAAGVTILTFVHNKAERKIQRGKCLGHSSSGSTMYAGMDMASGELVAVGEWIMKWRHVSKRSTTSYDKEEDPEGAAHLKQVLSIEQELLALLRLNHPNLIHYLGWKHEHQLGRIHVSVLMEYSGGTNLSVYTHHNNALPLEMLRAYISELLQAMKYLHHHSIVHKNLRASSVFIDCSGRVRLGDYSIDKRLGDLYTAVDKARPGVRFSDVRPMVLGRGGQRGDIYQLGLMMLNLISGQPLMESLPEIPPDLPDMLQDFLNKCLLRDERLRWTAAQLLEHSFIKESIPQHQLLTGAKRVQLKSTGKEVDDPNEENSDNKEEEEFEYLCSLVASGQSRLASEFELLKVLGKGGFGDVLKVKNKLDGRFYAIKRIPLNPKSKIFNKKMKREVKLLSRLNHENVVRYYCSWIEISDDPALSETSSSFTSSSQAQDAAAKKAPHIVRSIPLTKTPVLTAAGVKSANSSYDPIADVEKLVPRAGDESVEWMTSFDAGNKNMDSSSSEDEDEADVFGSSFMPKIERSDDSIVFDDDNNSQVHSMIDASLGPNTPQQEAEAEAESTQENVEPEEMVLKILYIQMEYCEKSTLRSCIDAGLCNDVDRVWRLFREIIEGLVHIHGKGMIHRDLKPVNIFLDSHDHVKIGDFGLATTDIIAKQGAMLDVTLPSPQDLGLNLSRSGYSSGDGNLTGKVGTALYVSPEVMLGRGKVHYDQKVDIYSLGIIFFEMCYKCQTTGMERVRIINNLRQPNILLPDDFNTQEFSNQSKIIIWLLNHDPALRPTSKELLSSDLLPPPLMQETELSEILRSTICNPQSSSYRYMLNAIFKQNVSPLHEITYDQGNFENTISWKMALVYQHLEKTLIKIFTGHGALHIPLPLFMPKCSVYEGNEQIVMVMDHRGGIVTVPFDHRVPFARYVIRNNVQSLKRYAIEKVFREKKFYNVLFNVHPKELTECAFDIITPHSSTSLFPDAEVLTVVQEIINRFPALQAKQYYVRINHMSLLKGVLLHCGIAEHLHTKAISLLTENTSTKKRKTTALETDLKIKMSEQASTQLNSLLDLEGPIAKVSSVLKSITKTMGLASSLVKSGLHDMEHILSHATILGLKLQVIVTVGLIYNPSQYSGLMFEVMCENSKKKKLVTEVLAAGGRYDKLIEKFKAPVLTSSHEHPHGVGISLSFERLAAIVAEDHEYQALSPCDIIVCALGTQLLLKERLAVARDLWSAGFRADVLYEKTEDFDALYQNCRNRGISYIVILKDIELSSTVKVQSIFKMSEKAVYLHELVDFFQRQKMFTDKTETVESFPNQRTSLKESQNYGDTSSHTFSSSSHTFSSSSHTFSSNNPSNTNSNGLLFSYNITFVSQDSKKNQMARRRHEAVIASKAATQYPWLPDKYLDVLAVEMTTASIKTLQAYLELSDESLFDGSTLTILEKLGKQKKYLLEVFDAIRDLRFKKKCHFLLVYSIREESLRILT